MTDAEEAYGRFLCEMREHLTKEFWDRPDLGAAVVDAKVIRSKNIGHLLEFQLPGGGVFKLGFRRNLLTDDKGSKVFALELPGRTIDKDTPHLPPWTRGQACRNGQTFAFLQVEWAHRRSNEDHLERLSDRRMSEWLLGVAVGLARFASHLLTG